MSTDHDTAVVAAFFMAGMDLSEDLLRSWGKGLYELIFELTQYSKYCWDLALAGSEAACEFPGVYEYDVCSPFGNWFGGYILENKEAPSSDKAHNEVLRLAKDYFSGIDNSVIAALEGVPR